MVGALTSWVVVKVNGKVCDPQHPNVTQRNIGLDPESPEVQGAPWFPTSQAWSLSSFTSYHSSEWTPCSSWACTNWYQERLSESRKLSNAVIPQCDGRDGIVAQHAAFPQPTFQPEPAERYMPAWVAVIRDWLPDGRMTDHWQRMEAWRYSTHAIWSHMFVHTQTLINMQALVLRCLGLQYVAARQHRRLCCLQMCLHRGHVQYQRQKRWWLLLKELKQHHKSSGKRRRLDAKHQGKLGANDGETGQGIKLTELTELPTTTLSYVLLEHVRFIKESISFVETEMFDHARHGHWDISREATPPFRLVRPSIQECVSCLGGAHEWRGRQPGDSGDSGTLSIRGAIAQSHQCPAMLLQQLTFARERSPTFLLEKGGKSGQVLEKTLSRLDPEEGPTETIVLSRSSNRLESYILLGVLRWGVREMRASPTLTAPRFWQWDSGDWGHGYWTWYGECPPASISFLWTNTTTNLWTTRRTCIGHPLSFGHGDKISCKIPSRGLIDTTPWSRGPGPERPASPTTTVNPHLLHAPRGPARPGIYPGPRIPGVDGACLSTGSAGQLLHAVNVERNTMSMPTMTMIGFHRRSVTGNRLQPTPSVHAAVGGPSVFAVFAASGPFRAWRLDHSGKAKWWKLFFEVDFGIRKRTVRNKTPEVLDKVRLSAVFRV